MELREWREVLERVKERNLTRRVASAHKSARHSSYKLLFYQNTFRYERFITNAGDRLSNNGLCERNGSLSTLKPLKTNTINTIR
jgi:hypothetical protein